MVIRKKASHPKLELPLRYVGSFQFELQLRTNYIFIETVRYRPNQLLTDFILKPAQDKNAEQKAAQPIAPPPPAPVVAAAMQVTEEKNDEPHLLSQLTDVTCHFTLATQSLEIRFKKREDAIRYFDKQPPAKDLTRTGNSVFIPQNKADAVITSLFDTNGLSKSKIAALTPIKDYVTGRLKMGEYSKSKFFKCCNCLKWSKSRKIQSAIAEALSIVNGQQVSDYNRGPLEEYASGLEAAVSQSRAIKRPRH